jgi:copper(I)-binding protein
MKKLFFALLATSLLSTAALAQVTVTDPWVRATVPQQKSAGAFMQLQSATPARLVEVRSPLAGRSEIHNMRMEGSVMKMFPVKGIDLPAGKAVHLASGGYHVMLFNLKQQLKEGETVPLTLVVEDAKHKRHEVSVSVPVKPIGHSAAPAAGHPAGH